MACVVRDAAPAALLSREPRWAVRSVSLMGRATHAGPQQEQLAIVRRDEEQRAVCVIRDAAAAALLSREPRWAVRCVSLTGRVGTRRATATAADNRENGRGAARGLCPP